MGGIADIGSCSASKGSRLCPSVNCSGGFISSYLSSGSTQAVGCRASQKAVHFVRFLRQTNQRFREGKGTSHRRKQ
ncbi:hypothetical protein Patl1_00159 [Pistacia atlantica]|uniref:Uncharacterized protein n=1 Tax=Pistacia atlantica TaxID=434234 RepID=A0ACC1CB92_9ROSI|nr:hypothetical protein Patl1_00159 [Pistacia atlantica]